MKKKYYLLKKSTTFRLAIALIIFNCCFVTAENSPFDANVNTNSGSGLAPTYVSLSAAISALNAATITSPIIISLNTAELAPVGGYVITAQGSATNTILIQGNLNSVTANAGLTVGALNDAIFKLLGADYITIRDFIMVENADNTINTAAAINNMTEWGIALLYATSTNGAQNNTIQDNVISLNRTYTNTFGIYSNSTHTDSAPNIAATATTMAGNNTGLNIFGNSISDVNVGIVVVGPTSASNYNQTLTIGSFGLGNKIVNYGTGDQLSTYANVSASGYGILVRNTANYTISDNNLQSPPGGYTSTTTLRGIYVPAFSETPIGVLNQVVDNNSILLQPGASVEITCIHVEASTSNAASALSISNNDFSNVTHTVASTAAINFIINAVPVLTTAINNNTFSHLSVSTTGAVNFIANSVTRPAGSVCDVNNNSIVTAFNKTGGAGAVSFYESNSLTLATSTENNIGNNFSNITLTGTASISGWLSGDGTTILPYGPSKNISNNTFANIVGGTGPITIMSTSYSNANGNSIVANNTISNVVGGGAVIGITSFQGKQLFSNNTISGLSTTGSSIVNGISITGGSNQNLLKNKIGNLEANNAVGLVNGLIVSGGLLATISNNLIGDLRTPTRTGVADGIRGISLTSTTATSNINVYNNTINLNALSTGVDFSSSGIFHTTSATATTAALDLRNNIIVNNSVPTGTGDSVAFRLSAAGLANFAATSDNNNFVASVIYNDGVTTAETVGAYKTIVIPRDSSSFNAIPNFLSTVVANPAYLHINPAIFTPIESGGSSIATVTDDFDGDIRQGAEDYTGTGTTPDVGADEFGGLPVLSTSVFSDLTFSVHPNPASGIININSTTLTIFEVTVINLLGQTVLTKRANSLDIQIDLSGLSRAAYLIRVVADGQEKVIKVLKQ